MKKLLRKINLLSWLKVYIVCFYYTFFMTIYKIIPVKNNRIIFISYYGKGYGDNGKYITNELVKSKEKYEIIWATKRKFRRTLPSNVKYVRFNSLKYIFYLSTAKVWINNTRFFLGVRKRKNQYYIQTWHSSLRLKLIEKDAKESLKKQYIKAAKSDSKMCDLIISGCGFSSRIYKEAFWYNGKVAEIGTPRCDIFFKDNKQIIDKVYKYFNIDKKLKIILYAPTFRKNDINCTNFFDYDKLINKLNDENEKYVLLIRFHPNSKVNFTDKSVNKIYNATNYPDMQELISVCDVLITDYSGCCFDAMIAKKKCILFLKDLKEFLKKERELYFKFEDLPFKKVKDEDELIEAINRFDYKNYLEKIEEFDKIILNKEQGIAAKSLIERINKVIKNEKV